MTDKKTKVKKAKKDTDLKAKIKQMEATKREEAPVAVKAEKKLSFDSWYHIRKHKIPKQHMKEILIADFKSRGLGNEATMEEYDKALKLYGVKL